MKLNIPKLNIDISSLLKNPVSPEEEMKQKYINYISKPSTYTPPAQAGDIVTAIQGAKGIGSKILAGLGKGIEFVGTSTGQKLLSGLNRENPYYTQSMLQSAQLQKEQELGEAGAAGQEELGKMQSIGEYVRAQEQQKADLERARMEREMEIAAREPERESNILIKKSLMEQRGTAEKRAGEELRVKQEELTKKPLEEVVDEAYKKGDISVQDYAKAKSEPLRYKVYGAGTKLMGIQLKRAKLEEGKLQINTETGEKRYIFSDGEIRGAK